MSDTGERTKRKRLTDEERMAKMLAAIKEIKARRAKKDKAKQMEYVQIFALLGAGYIHRGLVDGTKADLIGYLSESEFCDLNNLCKSIYGKAIPRPETFGAELPEELRFVSFKRRRRAARQVEQNTVSKT